MAIWGYAQLAARNIEPCQWVGTDIQIWRQRQDADQDLRRLIHARIWKLISETDTEVLCAVHGTSEEAVLFEQNWSFAEEILTRIGAQHGKSP